MSGIAEQLGKAIDNGALPPREPLTLERMRELATSDQPDPWRMAEWNALPDVCLFWGCDSDEIDQRGPVWLRDGSMRKACVEHWEGIMGTLGRQSTWEQDAMRSGQ